MDAIGTGIGLIGVVIAPPNELRTLTANTDRGLLSPPSADVTTGATTRQAPLPDETLERALTNTNHPDSEIGSCHQRFKAFLPLAGVTSSSVACRSQKCPAMLRSSS